MKFEALQRLFSTIYIFSDSMLNTREQIQNPCIAATAENNKVGESGTKNLTNIDL
jgi:hypothetical protein